MWCVYVLESGAGKARFCSRTMAGARRQAR